VNLWALYW